MIEKEYRYFMHMHVLKSETRPKFSTGYKNYVLWRCGQCHAVMQIVLGDVCYICSHRKDAYDQKFPPQSMWDM